MLIRDHFQNYKSYQLPKAQLIIADVPYNLGNNAYASNPAWYKDGDNKNGESELAGFDLWEFYKKYSINKSGYMRLNRNLKRPYIDNMQKLCKELGMRFYVSDAHFKERCDGANCCGLLDRIFFKSAEKDDNGDLIYKIDETRL